MQIDGEKMETVRDFILGGSKITTDGDFSHEIKRHLLLGSKVMTNLDSVLKSSDVTLPTKVCLVRAMFFNMLPSFAIFFSSKEQVSFNFMAAVTIFSDFGAQENKICHCFHFFPIYLHVVMGLDSMILVF